MRSHLDVGLPNPNTRYRISIFDKVVLQVKIDGLTETYWRDANKTDLSVVLSPANKFRISWFGKVILQVPFGKTTVKTSRNGEPWEFKTVEYIDADLFNLNIEDRPK